MKKFFLLLTLILFTIPHCGYSPIYLGNDNINFDFNIVEIDGNDEMNKLFVSNFKRISSKSAKTKINLIINTFYTKNILTKNKAGKATSYSLIKKVKFNVISANKSQVYNFQEDTKTTSMTSEFELKNYESAIKNNFVNSKIEELIYKLSNIK